MSHYLEASVAGGSSAAWLSLEVAAAWSYGIAHSLNILITANLPGSTFSGLHCDEGHYRGSADPYHEGGINLNQWLLQLCFL